MAALANYVHSLGLKFGTYVTPGIPVAAYEQNTPIESNGSSVVGAVSVNLPLNQGVNSIVIANRNAPAPDIDSIIVSE